MPEKQLTKIQKRLLKLFAEIKDEDVRDILIDMVGLEAANRSSHNFPTRKVKDIIDGAARKQERDQ